MKKHDKDFLIKYGINNYNTRCSSASDGNPNDGKWYNRMNTGCVCGDNYTVLRIRMVGTMPIIQQYTDYDS